MKAILMSIKPKWCEKIFSGKKTVEVRKIAPKLETPYKVYVYQTKGKEPLLEVIKDGDDLYGEVYHGETVFVKGCHRGLGKVVGEFVCDENERFTVGSLRCDEIEELACLSHREMIEYFYKPEELDGETVKAGTALHITKPKRYDTPKALSEFRKPDEPFHTVEINENGNVVFCDGYIDGEPITRPPQSWMYVEETEE